MNYLTFTIWLCAISNCFTFYSLLAEDCCIEECATYSPDIAYVSHIEGHGVGYRDGYSTLGLFLSSPNSWNNCIRPFIDLRGHVFNSGRPAANAGIGARYLSPCSDTVLGGNFFYDFREGQKKSYHQVGLGFEILSPRWDFRANGYLPVGPKRGKIASAEFLYPGRFFAFYEEHERTAAGGDIEVGFHVKRRGVCDFFGFYAASGSYYFDTKGIDRKAWGGKIRLVAELGKYINVEVRSSYDRVFHGTVQGLVSLIFPFGGPCDRSNCNRMDALCDVIAAQPVQRNEMIVLDHQYRWKANF